MVSHDDFATFEQRPHGLMEVVVPGDSWLFGTVLPWRVNWPILREFIAQWCPLGMLVDRLEIMLSGVHLTEQLVECWHGFYARIVMTYGGSPSPGLLPFRQLWAPLPHLHHTMMGSTIRKHTSLCSRRHGTIVFIHFRSVGQGKPMVRLAPRSDPSFRTTSSANCLQTVTSE